MRSYISLYLIRYLSSIYIILKLLSIVFFFFYEYLITTKCQYETWKFTCFFRWNNFLLSCLTFLIGKLFCQHSKKVLICALQLFRNLHNSGIMTWPSKNLWAQIEWNEMRICGELNAGPQKFNTTKNCFTICSSHSLMNFRQQVFLYKKRIKFWDATTITKNVRVLYNTKLL